MTDPCMAKKTYASVLLRGVLPAQFSVTSFFQSLFSFFVCFFQSSEYLIWRPKHNCVRSFCSSSTSPTITDKIHSILGCSCSYMLSTEEREQIYFKETLSYRVRTNHIFMFLWRYYVSILISISVSLFQIQSIYIIRENGF